MKQDYKEYEEKIKMNDSFENAIVTSVELLDYDILSVCYSDGSHASMDGVGVTVDWLTLDKEEFFKMYGFDFIPPEPLKNKALKNMAYNKVFCKRMVN